MLSRLKSSVSFAGFSFVCAFACDVATGCIASQVWLAALSIVFGLIAIVVGVLEFCGLFEEFEDYKGV